MQVFDTLKVDVGCEFGLGNNTAAASGYRFRERLYIAGIGQQRSSFSVYLRSLEGLGAAVVLAKTVG